MGRVIPIYKARRYRRRRRLRHLLVAGAIAVALFALFPDTNTARHVRDTALPRALNGGQAWGGTGGQDAARSSNTHVSVALAGAVTRVRDGDTVVVGKTPIRIANLDCAERGTANGDRATRRAKELLAGRSVTCALTGHQSYDREVGTCRLLDGRNLGAVLIGEGFCERWSR